MFKYYFLDDSKNYDELSKILSSILKGNLQISSTKNYNDPYEFYYLISFEDKYYNKEFYDKASTYGKMILQQVEILKENGKADALKKIETNVANSGITELQNGRARICSLTETYDDILMWGHYAKSHTGFCVEYSTDNKMFKNHLYPVCYLSKVYDATHLVLGVGEFKKPNLLCKSKKWEYENEWRLCFWNEELTDLNLISNDSSKAIVDLGVNVQKVYLGINCSDKVKDIIRQNSEGIEVIQLKQSKNKYELMISSHI